MILRNLIETTLVPHTAFQNAVLRLEQCFTYSLDAVEPICIALIGESRTGKSRALEECERSHPRSRDSDGLRVPILRVKTPSKPTVKGLVELMLEALEDPKFTVGTENQKTSRLRSLMRGTGVVMVMIDEFQHFYDKGRHTVMHHVADWLKILVDDSKVTLVVAGLPTCRAVLAQNEQLSGRFLAPLQMPRFDWKREEHREEFKAILGAFHEALEPHFDLPQLDSEDMAFRCYCGTGGLIGYLTKFFRQVVWDAIDGGAQMLTLEDLARAHEKSVWTGWGPVSIASPFENGFCLKVNDGVLAKIASIGQADVAAPAARKRRVKNVAAAAKVSDVLSAA